MAAKLAKENLIKPFDGQGDIQAWLAKVELVAKLTTTKDIASLIPLYLEGGALSLYLEMPEAKRVNETALKRELLKAYSDSEFVSFSKLKGVKWTGEPVDVFANDVRRMARGCGLKGDGLEQVVKVAFVTGFPEHISVELQQIQGVETMSVGEIIPRARVLASTGGGNVVAPAIGKPGQGVKCFGCGGPHVIRNCPEREKREKREVRCYRCNVVGHIAKFCSHDMAVNDEKNKEKGFCAAGLSLNTVKSKLSGVPVIEVMINGKRAQALVDTGCSKTMVREGLIGTVKGRESGMVAFDGREVKCKGSACVTMLVGTEKVCQEVMVVGSIVGEIDAVMGMDIIERLGGVKVKERMVRFGDVCAVAWREQKPDIVDKDFEAYFDGKTWEVRYFWNANGAPLLKNKVGEYAHNLDEEKKKAYEAEVERWIEEGILAPWEGDVNGVIPLMAVEQETKKKVRPVMDFRELNKSVSCHTGDDITDVCSEKLREWRQLEGDGELVDLKAAYLQIRVSRDLWQYQLVRYKGRVYCLTRLGFGLNSAPRIMSKILKTVLAKNDVIQSATSSFVDDIMVNTSQVPASKVVDHLLKHGLVAKEPESLEGGAALGLKLKKDSDGRLMFSRANVLPDVTGKLTKKELFSACGKLVGHYPKGGWLRVACSYVKRHAKGDSWDDHVDDATMDRMREIVDEVKKYDPVRGVWSAPKVDSGTVWCDASDLAMGVMLEVGGVEVEDACWMRKKDDFNHINVAELEAVVKGINLCAKWGLKEVTVMTDSATVCGWARLTLTEERKVRTKGAAEILIKRRLGALKSVIQELGMKVEVKLVKSGDNKADRLTRVKKRWLVHETSAACAAFEDVQKMHRDHHMGVERTLYLARKMDKSVDKEMVKAVVGGCQQCQSIDPAPTTHVAGELGVQETWSRLAIDVTHYGGRPYLSIVDCGPGRFMIWKELNRESATEICGKLNEIFYERGPVNEVLMDNAMAFRSQEMLQLLEKWRVRPYYRAAYRPGGNGIVERSHRTIKAMAERSGKSPIDAVFWYNMSPRCGQNAETVPQRSVFTYEWRQPEQSKGVSCEEVETTKVQVGDEVWVKPGHCVCTTRWGRGVVTGIGSDNNVEVDGIPRHILDVRPVVDFENADGAQGETVVEGTRRCSERARHAPAWMRDYIPQ